MIVFLSPNYFRSERCAAELALWLESEERRSLPDAGIALIQLADVPGLFADGQVDVPQELEARFSNWVAELRKGRIADEFDLRERTADSVDMALDALCRLGR